MAETRITLEGMHCKSCEMLVADELGELEGVKKAEANHKDGVVKITHEGSLDTDRVRKAVSGLGFKVKQ